MKWDEQTSKDKSVFSATADSSEIADLTEGFSAAIEKACEEIPKRYKEDSWQKLYCEFWLDSGRLIIYPAKKGELRSKWKVGVQLTSPCLIERFDKLPNPDADADDFEVSLLSLQHSVWGVFAEAARSSKTRSKLKGLMKHSEFRVFVQFGSDEDSVQELFWM